jgi:CSLREA domain-containing protein
MSVRHWPVWIRHSLAPPLAAGIGLTAGAAAAHDPPATRLSFTVTTTADAHDTNPGDGRCAASTGQCTLRAAVEEAVAQPRGTAVSITLPAGTYPLTLGSLDFDGGPVSVAGAGARAAVIEATGRFRVLEVGSAATVTLSGVTITGGRPQGARYGGGVLNTGHLQVIDSIVTANMATAGGGIANAGGTVILSRSSVTGNTAPVYGGGGIQNGGFRNVAGTVEVIASIVTGNVSGGDGGGILNGQNGRPGRPGRPATPVRSACAWIPRCARSMHPGPAAPPAPGPPTAPGPPAPRGLRLVVTGSRIDGNTGTNSGAGIANDGGTAVVTGSTLNGNKAARSPGGGIANYGPLTLLHDTLHGNQAAYGGALEAAYAGTPGRQVVTDSSLTGNTALAGGAIDDGTDTLYVTASTLAGNSADLGGAIEVQGAAFVYLRNSTLTGNSARPGAGGAVDTYACGGGVVSYSTIAGNTSGLNLPCSNLTVTGSIIAASAPGPNCAGAAPHESAGYNLDTGVSCAFAKPTDLTAADPQLAPLAANGGPTPTQVPADGSPAINHGGTRATGCPATDQRGVSRPQGPACDIGAVEVQPGV